MPRSYRIMTALLALTGCISLVITGELMPVFMIPGLAIFPGYYRVLKGLEPAPRWVIAVLSLLTAGLVAFDTLTVSGDFFIAVAHMTIIFQALKSFDLREPWDHLQVYFMSLLQLIMASELAISMAVGGMFVVFLVIFVTAIVLSHFMKEDTLGSVSLKRPVAIITLAAFATTAIFFLAVPRARGSIWQRKSSTSIRAVGFSDKVDLGSFGRALEDSRVVMRVSISGPKLPLYWRGITLDYFDGYSWKDTMKRSVRVRKAGGKFDFHHPGSPRVETIQKIHLEPIDTDVVFGLGEIVAVEAPGWYISRDVAMGVKLPFKNDRRFTYTAYSIPGGDLGVRRRYTEYYLQLPAGMERVAALAKDITAGAVSEHDAARRIEDYLKTNYQYSLETIPPPQGVTPIEYFLFDSKTGYCEHYATSMVLMLRSLGIPARIVNGFSGGEGNTDGDYVIVRQRDAHSWVEAAIEGKWVRFDPTPPAPKGALSSFALMYDSIRMSWYRYVVGFDAADQRTIFSSVTAPSLTLPEISGISLHVRPVYLIVIAGLLILVAMKCLAFGFSPKRSFETAAYMKLRRTIARRGGVLKPSSSPREVLLEAGRLEMDVESAYELVRLYEDARFGGVELGSGDRARCRELFEAVVKK